MHLSDNLAKLAQLIDFGQDSADKVKQEEEKNASTSKGKAVESKAQKPWPWEWLRNSLVYVLIYIQIIAIFNVIFDNFDADIPCSLQN